MRGEHHRLPAAVALISGAALGYELLLLRFFALMYWHHFAHLIISIALLGIGVSGTVLTLFQARMAARFHQVFSGSALLFALTLPAAITLGGRLGFNPPELIWDWNQGWRLGAMFLLAALPFFWAGLCIGLTLRCAPLETGRIYRADLAGAGGGALLMMALLFVLSPAQSVRVAALAAVGAALLGGRRACTGTRWQSMCPAAAGVLLTLLWPTAWLSPPVSPFKALSQTLQIPGMTIASETRSPAGTFTALMSDSLPFRSAPGLSMLAPSGPPAQIALFHDGHPAGVIHGAAESAVFMRWTPMALPYSLLATPPPRVLVAGAGGGGDVRHALLEGAVRVDAVEPHRELTGFVRHRFRTFAGGIYAHEAVHLHHGDTRGVLAAAGRGRFDLIQISPFGTAVPPAGGGHALTAAYLFTTEGLLLAISRLSDNGILSVSVPLDLPPRRAVKLLDTVATALRQMGVEAPERHVAVIRAWNLVTLAVSRTALSPVQRQAARDFCRTRAFDLVWLPGLDATEINRVNVLEQPFFHEVATAIWRGTAYRRGYPFHVVPATDDRPWFNRFFRWRTLPALWTQRASGSAAMLEWEYLLLWKSLAVAATVSLLLMALPLALLPRRRPAAVAVDSGHTGARMVYFAALGLAFLFLEIAFIQKFVLFLRDPMLSLAVIVPSFLFFAGIGSGRSGRLAAHGRVGLRNRPVLLAAAMITAVSGIYLWLLPPFFRIAAAWPDAGRMAVSVALIGVPAFWMGMPFPLGLQRLKETAPQQIPFAWGVNGFFSVISAIAAMIAALHAGFRAVILLALGLYLLAATLERRL